MKFISILFCCLTITMIMANSDPYDEWKGIRYADMAASAYCNPVDILAWNCSTCTCRDVATPMTLSFDPISQTLGYVAIEDNHDHIDIVFRGTEPNIVANILIDLVSAVRIEYPHISNALVAQGFYEAFVVHNKEIEPLIKPILDEYPNKIVIITGHSLGGAIATMMATDWVARGVVTGDRIKLITFGSPRVGNNDFAHFGAASNISVWRITHAADPVVHLPPTILGFTHYGDEIWYPKSTIGQPGCPITSGATWINCTTDKMENPNCSAGVPLPIIISDHLTYMGFTISESCCNVKDCPDGFWAPCCDQPCDPSQHCARNGCDQNTGYCKWVSTADNDCQTGWYGLDPTERYASCDQPCLSERHCTVAGCTVGGGYCPFTTDNECQTGWYGDDPSGKYTTCDKQCDSSYHCIKPGCTEKDGSCYWNVDVMCQVGWWGLNENNNVICNRACDASYHCAKGCSSDLGYCVGGCEEGWWGTTSDGKYYTCDQQCDPNQHCSNAPHCNNDNGRCEAFHPCVSGWCGQDNIGATCTALCPSQCATYCGTDCSC